MNTYTGKSIFKGIAIGRILFYQKAEQAVTALKYRIPTQKSGAMKQLQKLLLNS